jgi:integron integrase
MLTVHSPPPFSQPASPRLLDQVRSAMRVRHYSKATELAYVSWIRRFILFHRKRHPRSLAEADVAAFLNHLASERRVSPSTQNQALAALLFLYREVLGRELGWVAGIARARYRVRSPVVLSREEVTTIIGELSGKARLIVALLYGSGMRVNECLRLRVKDIDFDDRTIAVVAGKGGKDRMTLLPESIIPALRRHLEVVRRLYEDDRARGYGEADVPPEIAHRFREASTLWPWQLVFPRTRLAPDPRSGRLRRQPLDDRFVQHAVRAAALRAGIAKPVTCHSMRHAFASHLLRANVDIRTVQSLLGHQEVTTTMIYTHVAIPGDARPESPVDVLSDSKQKMQAERNRRSPGTD